jgi:hypothetical protein
MTLISFHAGETNLSKSVQVAIFTTHVSWKVIVPPVYVRDALSLVRTGSHFTLGDSRQTSQFPSRKQWPACLTLLFTHPP